LEELTVVQPPQIVAAVEQLCMRGWYKKQMPDENNVLV
jgi:hypothetical protein